MRFATQRVSVVMLDASVSERNFMLATAKHFQARRIDLAAEPKIGPPRFAPGRPEFDNGKFCSRVDLSSGL